MLPEVMKEPYSTPIFKTRQPRQLRVLLMKIHLLNASLPFAHSHGKLNDTLFAFAIKTLEKLGHQVTSITLRDGYNKEHELEAIKNADAVLYHFPGWWMDMPWILKKYVDEVFTEGQGVLYKNDGRSRSEPTAKYGTGGLCQGKKYMFTTTWNAPLEAFTEPDQFFEGHGIDGLLFPFHRTHAFLGMVPLPSFMVNDVEKAPDIPKALQDYEEHLTRVFGSV